MSTADLEAVALAGRQAQRALAHGMHVSQRAAGFATQVLVAVADVWVVASHPPFARDLEDLAERDAFAEDVIDRRRAHLGSDSDLRGPANGGSTCGEGHRLDVGAARRLIAPTASAIVAA